MEKRLEKIDEQINEINAKLNNPMLCDGTAETYSRVSGYYRSVANWNDGKAAEFTQRVEYAIDGAKAV